MAKVEAPNKDYNGPGPGGVVFENGVADVDDDAALNYYRGAGYKVSGKVDNPVETPEPPDPREVTHEVVGTQLRDAAVDPQPEDFLPPINAGDGNPHGSTVVSPEIHASGPAGLRPGEVFVEDLEKQQVRESAFAEARLVDQATAAEAVKAEVADPEDHGPIGLSDPGSVKAGVNGAKDAPAPSATTDVDVDDPGTSPAPVKKAAAKKAPARKTAAKKTAAKKAAAKKS